MEKQKNKFPVEQPLNHLIPDEDQAQNMIISEHFIFIPLLLDDENGTLVSLFSFKNLILPV